MQAIQNVFVIGNGFDLSLGLPTSYGDFIKSSQFTTHLASSKLFRHIHDKAYLERWVDIEAELADISQNETDDPNFLQDYKSLCASLSSYINSIDISKMNKTSPAYDLFRSNYRPSESYVANFNYTNTVQFILNELSIEKEEIDSCVHHIHGECRNNSIIFGVNDDAKVNPEHVFLYKSTANQDGGRGIKQALKNASRIFFFGHSFGESDHMYLEDLFLNLRLQEMNVELHFYHYGEAGYLDLHKKFQLLTSNNVSNFKSNNYFNAHDTSISA